MPPIENSEKRVVVKCKLLEENFLRFCNCLVFQIDQLKQELSKKESELLALQTKLETLSNQNSDCKQHIEVLKESLTAKEQRAAILQTEVRRCRGPWRAGTHHHVPCFSRETFHREPLPKALGAICVLGLAEFQIFSNMIPVCVTKLCDIPLPPQLKPTPRPNTVTPSAGKTVSHQSGIN